MSIEIGLRWVRVSLRGYGGEVPSGAVFFDFIALEPERAAQARPSESAWQSANLELFAVDMSDLQAYPEPFEEFAVRVERGFLDAAAWLDARPHDALDRWRGQGRRADIFIGGWLANEQFDLVVPAQFLLACGRAKLPIQMCTND
jgi:hypothetical protein